MTDYTVFQDAVRDWVGRSDFSDATVTSIIRMAETTLSQSLRVRQMVVRADAIIANGRVALPLDFIEAEIIRITNGAPLVFRTPDEFYVNTVRPKEWYTILGEEIEFGAPIPEIEGLRITMSYFQHVPTFVDVATWLYTYHYNIYLQACNASAALYAQEFERATSIEGIVSGLVEIANMNYNKGKISGSTLRTRLVRKRIG